MFGFSCSGGSVFHPVLSWPYRDLIKNIFQDSGCGSGRVALPPQSRGQSAGPARAEGSTSPSCAALAELLRGKASPEVEMLFLLSCRGDKPLNPAPGNCFPKVSEEPSFHHSVCHLFCAPSAPPVLQQELSIHGHPGQEQTRVQG